MIRSSFLTRALITAGAFLLIGGGCVSVKSDGEDTIDASFFRSQDRAANWEKSVALPSAKTVGSIANVNTLLLVQSAAHPQALYLGTERAGLFYSYDRGASWAQAKDLAQGEITAIAVNPKNKCVSYAAIGNRVMRSLDCNLTYQISYVDARPDTRITSIVVDFFDPRKVYTATSEGDMLRSLDDGSSWAPLERFNGPISKILMSVKDSRIMWVAMKTKGIWKTVDGGDTWVDQTKGIKDFDGARAFSELVEDVSAPGTLIHASTFGLLRSRDGGDTWEQMSILTPPEATKITSLALNPADGNEIYYTAARTLYISSDGGASWTTEKTPAPRLVTALHVDIEDGSVVYMGMYKPKR